MTLSILLVAHNEESVIEDALKSAQQIAGAEIVCVLDRCTDGTKALCEKYAHKIIEGAWEVEGERRNLGIEACTHNWVFELDADERFSPELAAEITAALPTLTQGYVLIPIDNYVGTRLVRHGWAGSFGTTRAKKLFTKGSKIWGMQRVHPSLELYGKEQALTQPLIHLVDKDINDMIDRLQRYSDAAAADLRTHGKLPHFAKTLRKSVTRFYKSYLGRKGYKEGKYGFLLALMSALFPLLSHLKAELEPQKK